MTARRNYFGRAVVARVKCSTEGCDKSGLRSGMCRSCSRKAAAVAKGLKLRTPAQRREVYRPDAAETARIEAQLEELRIRRRELRRRGYGGLTEADIWANAAVRTDGPAHAAFGRSWGTGTMNSGRAAAMRAAGAGGGR